MTEKPWRSIFAVLVGVPIICIAAEPPPATQPTFRVGTITSPAIPESSGIVPSRRHPGVFWTHNDSGNPASVFAITREGRLLREFSIAATNVDWEDIELDEAGQLYLADIGNNRANRTEVQIYRIDEPDPEEVEQRGKPQAIRVNATWRLRYPGKPFDAESFFVFKGMGYVISKRRDLSPAELYRFDLRPSPGPVTLEKCFGIPAVRFPATAAEVSDDGKQLVVQTVAGPYLFQIDGDVNQAAKVQPRYARYFSPHMEAACFVPEGILATTESRDVFLFRDADFSPPSAKK